MRVYERQVRFEEVDAAQIVFFPRFFGYCHEAMEALFDEIEGGYVHLVRDRKIGVPAVHVACDFKHPLRYGDVARIEASVATLGNTSVTFRYAITNRANAVPVASIDHVCVVSDLTALKGIPIPLDVRTALARYLANS
jgi:4-hydroxybenzoyl-CoA thioesterase